MAYTRAVLAEEDCSLQSRMWEERRERSLERWHKKRRGNGVPHKGITWVNLPFKQQIVGSCEGEQLQVGDWKQCNWVPPSESSSKKYWKMTKIWKLDWKYDEINEFDKLGRSPGVLAWVTPVPSIARRRQEARRIEESSAFGFKAVGIGILWTIHMIVFSVQLWIRVSNSRKKPWWETICE